jgi:hypothetical protein
MAKQPFSIDQLLGSLGATARGSHLRSLGRPMKAMLKDFVTYLVEVEGKSPSTATAYKSYVAKAIAEGGARDSQVKSAMMAFGRYWASR